MVNKNKNNQDQNSESLAHTAAEHIGMLAVGVAAVINVAGLAHLSQDQHTTAVLQPLYAVSQAQESETASEELRRPGREEIRHSSASFGAFQRSPNTAGTI